MGRLRASTQYPSYSPVGTRLAVEKRVGDNYEVAVAPVDYATTYNPVSITNNPAIDGFPSWGTIPAAGPKGDPPAVTPTCQGKPATVLGTAGNDTLTGTGAADVIVAQEGNDKVNAGGGNDLVCGGEGKDALAGKDGKDKLFGEGGKDTLNGGAGKGDVCNGGPKKDKAKGSCEKEKAV